MSRGPVWRVQEAAPFHRIGALGAAALAAYLFAVPSAPAQENCCLRKIYTAPFTMPAGDSERWSNSASVDATSPLFDGVLQGTACPLEVWIIGRQADQDYRFEGEVTTEGLVQTDEFGNLHGNFVAKLRLIDPDHDNEVLREAMVTWTGTLTDGFNHRVYSYEPSTGALNPSWQDRTGELGRKFFDIQDLIYNHESKPQRCAVLMPEGSDSVDSGKTITINLTDIVDHQGSRPPAWQRVLVKVEKGEILNADDKWDDFYVFKIKESGDVAVQYKAPDNCRPDTETLTVWNTCTKKEDGSYKFGNEHQLATKEFDIVCDRWLVDVTYTEEMTYSGAPWKASRSFSQTLKAELNRTKKNDPESWGRRIYEATFANLDLEDRFQQVTESEEGCKVVAGWHGEHHGPVAVQVRMQCEEPLKDCFLDSGEVTRDLPVWKSTFQWSGCDPYPDAACEMTDASSAGVFNIGTGSLTDSGEPLDFEEGQEVLRGERRWSESGSDTNFQPEGNTYMSANCTYEGYQQPFTSLVYYGLAIEPLSEASKTITWKIRRPGASP